MRTVGEFKASGLLFVKDDACQDSEGLIYNSGWYSDANKGYEDFDSFTVSGFAWRTNTGVKPEFEGLIDVEWSNGEFDYGIKNSRLGFSPANMCPVKKWRPHLPAAIQTETPEEKEAFEAMNKSPYDVGAHVSGQRFGIMSDGSEVGLVAANDSNFDKPVFTQAMCDAGELPPVGSYFMLKGWARKGKMTAIGRDNFLFVFDKIEYIRELDSAEFSPIQTESEKAIDEIAMVISNEYAEVTGLVKNLDMFIGAATAIYDAGYRKPCSNNK